MSFPAQKARVLLVDDHPALLQHSKRLLQNEFEVVATLPNGSGLLDALTLRKPDVVVLDITLPRANGIELATQLRMAHSEIKIVFLTVHCDSDYARAAFAAGASGYVVKPQMASDLLPALRAVIKGGRFVSPCPELNELHVE
jgi:DNA-binding NarL/FixJ family response regulator